MEKVEKDLFGSSNDKQQFHHMVTGIEGRIAQKNMIREVANDDSGDDSSSSGSESQDNDQ